jgi:hypothetical protein
MDGQENSALFESALVTFRFIFGNAHANEGSRDAAHCAAHSGSSQSGHDRASRDKRPNAGDCQRADSDQPAQSATDHRARTGSGCRSFRRLGVLLVRELSSALLVGETRVSDFGFQLSTVFPLRGNDGSPLRGQREIDGKQREPYGKVLRFAQVG